MWPLKEIVTQKDLIKHQIDATLCRFYFCRVKIKPAQCCIKLAVLFDLYYDTGKHKSKIQKDLLILFK